MLKLKKPNFLRKFDLNNEKPLQGYIIVFYIALILATCIFLPFVILNKGYFLYLGDFNCQQIPFYMMSHNAVRSGNIFWSWTTDLGANFVGSYAFYLIGSPFFLFTLLFPNAWIPIIMPWLLVLKFALSAVTSYAFIKRFVFNKNYAFLSALMYAFSGFAVYNIFFNHFNEIIVLFPLLLIGIEELIVNNRKGIFAAAVFINALCNYYFFVAEVVFLVIYVILRIVFDAKKAFTLNKLFMLAFESVVGFGMALFIVFPAVLTTLQIDRAGNKLTDWAIVNYFEPQRYMQLAQAFFFPPEIPSQPNMYPNSGGKWASVNAFLPLFSMTGVFAYISRKKKSWLSIIIIVLITMLFMPWANASFQLLSNNFYTRWLFMLVLMTSLATGIALERCTNKQFKNGIIFTAIISSLIALPVAFTWNSKKNILGLATYIDRLWGHIIITVACIVLTALLIFFVKRNTAKFKSYSLVVMCAVIVIYGIYNVFEAKYVDKNTISSYIEKNFKGKEKFDFDDTTVYRVDIKNNEENAGMYWEMPGIQAFHSVVPGSVFDFYHSLGIKRDVSSHPEDSHLALRSLLSVKYLIDGDEPEQVDSYTKINTQNESGIYLYDNYIPFGFTFDEYIKRSDWDNLSNLTKEDVLLNSLIIEDEDVDDISDILTETDDVNIYSVHIPQLSRYRRAKSSSNFTRDNRGFSCDITPDKDTMIFFSVPFENGWSATVNGERAEIFLVDAGFMAVRVYGGQTNNIRFNYMTPGLITGLIVLPVCLVLLLLYVFANKIGKKPLLPFLELGNDRNDILSRRNIYFKYDNDTADTDYVLDCFYTHDGYLQKPAVLIVKSKMPEVDEWTCEMQDKIIEYIDKGYIVFTCILPEKIYADESEYPVSELFNKDIIIKTMIDFICENDEKYGIDRNEIKYIYVE